MGSAPAWLTSNTFMQLLMKAITSSILIRTLLPAASCTSHCGQKEHRVSAELLGPGIC